MSKFLRKISDTLFSTRRSYQSNCITKCVILPPPCTLLLSKVKESVFYWRIQALQWFPFENWNISSIPFMVQNYHILGYEYSKTGCSLIHYFSSDTAPCRKVSLVRPLRSIHTRNFELIWTYTSVQVYLCRSTNELRKLYTCPPPQQQ